MKKSRLALFLPMAVLLTVVVACASQATPTPTPVPPTPTFTPAKPAQEPGAGKARVSYYLGDENAPVLIEDFSDFQ